MGATTARKIIKKSLKKIGVIGVSGSVNAEFEKDTFDELNNMLELWSLEDLMVTADVLEEETLTSGTSVYTVGTGGTFSTNRPLDISRTPGDTFIRESSGTDHQVKVVTLDVYRQESTKTISGRPYFIAYHDEFPLGKIFVFPEANSSTDVLHYRAQVLLSSFATLTTSVNFPPGYEQAIINNLGVMAAPYFGKKNIDLLSALAAEGKKVIKSHNSEPAVPVKLPELTILSNRNRGHGHFN